ncbi:MAG: hypothetical protein GX424_07735 [Clostridiales bacterium]|nr:hypothetical protein [Clostridiales bacterium]
MAKTKVELICGFLESGKTMLIQKILSSEQMEQYESIAVLQCEEGETVLRAESFRNPNVMLDGLPELNRMTPAMFENLRRERNPDLILIEYNGTWRVSDFLKIRLPSGFELDEVLFCADGSTFLPYLNNTGDMMREPLSNADAVLFNRAAGVSAEELKSRVKSVNPSAAVCREPADTDNYLYNLLKKSAVSDRRLRRAESASAVFLLAVCAGLFAFTVPGFTTAYAFLQGVATAFLGILIQALPFLLIGIFVSSLLQLFTTDEQLARLFLRHPALSFPAAALLGIFFPVCDCGMAPIVSRLIRKGVPVPQAMTFFLAAPAINPVTIASTAFAFPGQTSYVVYRILFGMAVALLTGLLLALRKIGPDQILVGGAPASSCSAGFIGSPRCSGALGNAELVFRHAGLELFGTGRFLVCGALVSSILQASLPVSVFQGKGQSLLFALLAIILLSAVMSVCSTSNAFIGRSLLGAFPPIAVISFMVLGPMLDLSNLLMLSAGFRKNFVLKLAAVVFVTGFLVFWLFGQMIGI